MQTKIQGRNWPGAAGLAEDVRYYGKWMRDEAEKRIGHFYPKAKLPNGEEATVIAWLWARTLRCPNPACGAVMPLVRSFALSTKRGKNAWVEPVIDPGAKIVRFVVKTGEGLPPEGTVNRQGARCIICGTPVPFDHIRAEGQAGRMGAQLMAIVAEGTRGRVYLPPDDAHESVAAKAEPEWAPDTPLVGKAAVSVPLYGMKEGPFGAAETLSKAKNTSVEGMVQSGILEAGRGKVRLLGRDELDEAWNPSTDRRMNVWEMTQHLIRVLDEDGENAASELQERLGGFAESGRDLAYRLYSICERKGWSLEAQSYNSLVTVWPRLHDLASARREEGRTKGEQQVLEV